MEMLRHMLPLWCYSLNWASVVCWILLCHLGHWSYLPELILSRRHDFVRYRWSWGAVRGALWVMGCLRAWLVCLGLC
jgi:hypothetical protein